MRFFLLLFSGFFLGLCMSWPGILISNNWLCFIDIIEKSAEDKISIKAVLEISPSYLIKSKKKNITSRIRVVADACFR
tara:strand:- start:211 stop:444 length:234 start_codon:yes stop_codon:yes gene_type:complete